jgi:polysaccharide biosynthesis transport protein
LMGLAGVGGFACFAGLIVLSDLLSKRVSNISEVVRGLNLPIVGALPIMPRGLIDGRNGKKGQQPDAYLGMWKESVDSTRTLLLSHTASQESQTVMVTSAMSGEGKTTLACHLAMSLAESGRKTLLIDADLRRPAVHRVFGMSENRGLSEVLRQEATLAEVIQSHPMEGLFILPAGEVDPRTLRMLASDAAGPLLEQLKSQFDFVILDTAPVLPVTDALMIGPHAGGAVFAIRRDVSQRSKIASACERLERIGIPLLGAVVIGLDDHQSPSDRYTPPVSRERPLPSQRTDKLLK